ncbi:MAG: type II toxin-antitoxin system RelE/ParE family toxin [Ignavibacteria bacterium]|nr:type II toxin-antitoxin system RelE/ParE family toxin [Ignavibacteria bacterium]
MTLEIFWTKRADKKLGKICDYLNKDYGENSSNKFKTRINQIVNLLADFPDIGTLEVKERNIRGFIVVKQISLFYKVRDNNLIILNLFDNRQNPDKKKF